MNKTTEEEILQELQRISKLLVSIVTKDLTQQKDRIATLSHAGFEPKEIADLLGTTPHNVSVVLSDIRKKTKAEKGKKKAESND
jgi:DNA-binding NarL/FixJ family response regulator